MLLCTYFVLIYVEDTFWHFDENICSPLKLRLNSRWSSRSSHRWLSKIGIQLLVLLKELLKKSCLFAEIFSMLNEVQKEKLSRDSKGMYWNVSPDFRN